MALSQWHMLELRQRWKRLELAPQYFLASAAAALLICLFSGWTINTALQRQEISESTQETGLFLGGVLSTLLYNFDTPTLSEVQVARLDALMNNEDFAQRFPYLEIWLPNGEVAYSNSLLIRGKTFELPEQAREAFAGEITSTFSDLTAEEHTIRKFSAGLLEVYAPVRRLGSNEIIAVAEIHEAAWSLDQKLAEMTLVVWLFVVLGTVAAILSLSGFVVKAGQTIRAQRSDLAEKISSTLDLSALVGKSQQAAGLAEKRLKLASADLHDGPSQLIGFALLKLHEAGTAATPTRRSRAIGSIRSALITAQSEIRSIGQGLVLPDIAELSLDAIIDVCVEAHRKRTGARVFRDGVIDSAEASLEVRIALYRVVQEGLVNAFRHSRDPTVTIRASRDGNLVQVQLANKMTASKVQQKHEISGMGLDGLKARVSVLGGTLATGQIGNSFVLDVTLDLGHHDD